MPSKPYIVWSLGLKTLNISVLRALGKEKREKGRKKTGWEARTQEGNKGRKVFAVKGTALQVECQVLSVSKTQGGYVHDALPHSGCLLCHVRL